LCAAVAWKFGFGWQAFAALTLTWFLIALAFIDVDHQLLPDSLTLPLLWLGLLLSLWGGQAGVSPPPVDVRSSLIGAMAGYASLCSRPTSAALPHAREHTRLPRRAHRRHRQWQVHGGEILRRSPGADPRQRPDRPGCGRARATAARAARRALWTLDSDSRWTPRSPGAARDRVLRSQGARRSRCADAPGDRGCDGGALRGSRRALSDPRHPAAGGEEPLRSRGSRAGGRLRGAAAAEPATGACGQHPRTGPI